MGIEGRDSPNITIPRNILILSSGGKGHIPLLLWSIIYNVTEFPIVTDYRYDCIFLGVLWTHWTRPLAAQLLRAGLGNRTLVGQTTKWREIYATSKFILPPRGGGRNSYRLAEVLQMGMVPVYVYTDIIWLPYYDSINWSDFAVVVRFDQLSAVIPIFRNTTGETIARMRQRIHALYETHFSVPGTFNQIFKFLRGGFGRTDLRCAAYSYKRDLWARPSTNHT
jgi:hypothetical protein